MRCNLYVLHSIVRAGWWLCRGCGHMRVLLWRPCFALLLLLLLKESVPMLC